MAKDPALLVYTKDFLEGTADLEPEEMGVYCRLIFHQHQRGVLPADMKKLARLANVSINEFTNYWESIKNKFQTIPEGLVNKRCANEIAKRSLSARKKSILATLGNYIKHNSELKKSEKTAIKDQFSVLKYMEIENDKDRKDTIIKDLNDILAKRYAQRSHIIGNGNANNNSNINNNFSLLLSFLETSVNELPIEQASDSRTFHNAVFEKLKQQGYQCHYEYPIEHGRIDILVDLKDGDKIALELDNRTPRGRNLMKMEGTNFKVVSILRDPYPDKSYQQFNCDGIVLYRKRFPEKTIETNCLDEAEKDMLSSTEWRTYIQRAVRAIQLQLTNEAFDDYIKSFTSGLRADEDTNRSVSQYKSHFRHWLIIQLKSTKNAGKNGSTKHPAATQAPAGRYNAGEKDHTAESL